MIAHMHMYVDEHASTDNADHQSLPFFLNGLISEKVALINKRMVENEVPFPPVQDPTDCILHVLNLQLDWYNHLRQPSYSASEIFDISIKTYQFQKALKLVFPRKSGKLDEPCHCSPLCPLHW